jgi:outer membrane protein insertion porin family
MRVNQVYFLFALLIVSLGGYAQTTTTPVLDLSIAQEYRIGGITVVGAEYTDVQAVKLFSALQIGTTVTIPGEQIGRAITNLWDQDLFSNISIEAADLIDRDVYLVIRVEELPRLTRYSIAGVSRSEQETIRGKIDLMTGRIVNENVITTAVNRINDHYLDKGFLDIEVDIVQEVDSSFANGTIVRVNINKGDKVKIDLISINGVTAFEVDKLKRKMKSTKEKKWWRFYKASKYLETSFEDDMSTIIAAYNSEGYRNARILNDSIYRTDEGLVGLVLNIEEGNQFHFGDIAFTGNTKYRTTQLDSLLGIKKGDIYNLAHLEQRVFMDPKGMDLSSLYQDDGYLTFRAMPLEQSVNNDTINIEIRMMEGQQFRIGRIIVEGNTKTNDHVIYREIRTRPGDLFSRTDIIRTQRELAQLNYFNPEAFGVNPIQHPEDGTVDIEYSLEEKPSDQVEISGGWGGGRVVGSLVLSFTNFSAKKIFDKGGWRPIPTGDGQTISIMARSNGLFFQSYQFRFVEPWLGGHKPNQLSTRIWKSVQSNGQPKYVDGENGDRVENNLRNSLEVVGIEIGLGSRLKKPDDWFLARGNISYQHYLLKDYGSFFSFSNGRANNLSADLMVQRSSVSDPIFPTWGSNIEVSVKATLPYSLFRDEGYYDDLSEEDKYKWVEYHKWKFKAEWYTPLTRSGGDNPKSLVLKLSTGVGIIGQYDRAAPLSPFERFYMGGVFLSGFSLDGREILNLRGYDDLSLTEPNGQTGAPVAAKYTAELRYPLSTNPSATIYTLAFIEGGKTWEDSRAMNPFQVYRSAGVGLRVFLPMFGLLGLDYGWRFDDVSSSPSMPRGQFHFSMGMGLGEL